MTTVEGIYDQLNKLGEDMARKKAEYSALDRATKNVLALCKAKINEPKSDAAREMAARQDPQFLDHQTKLNKAHLEFELAEVAYENYRVYVDLLRTKAANRRAEMNLR